MVGYGLSDKPEAFSYSIFQQADIAQGLIEQLGLSEVHVVSHDISTSVHNELQAREREGKLPFKILSSMFLNGSILQWVSSEPESQNKFQCNETIFEGMKGLPAVQANLPEILKQITFKRIPNSAYTLKQELMGFRDGHLRLASQSVYMRERYIHADRWIGAMETASPLRICWAKDDPIANVQIGRELDQRCKQAEYVEWEGVGHFPNFEDPDFVAKQIEISIGIGARPEE
jgi:pimeloyl-ACP methyl ester carboxylesterase